MTAVLGALFFAYLVPLTCALVWLIAAAIKRRPRS